MKWKRDELPREILDDERSWQGDHDPYLVRLAHEGHAGRSVKRRAAERVPGPPDDGDPYLVQLARSCRSDSAD